MIEFTAPTELDRRREGPPPTKADVSSTALLVTGNPFTDVARSMGKTPVADRAWILNRIADRIMQNRELRAKPEPGTTPSPAANPGCRYSAGRSLALLRRRHVRKARTPRTTTPRRISTAPRSESRATSNKVPTTRFA